MRLIAEIAKDIGSEISYFVKSNLRNTANVLNFILPFFMYAVGYVSDKFINWCLIFPLGVFILVYSLRSAANKLGTGNMVPVPNKRFTEVSDDGEVSVDQNRIQELILYVADLEDWMERKNIL